MNTHYRILLAIAFIAFSIPGSSQNCSCQSNKQRIFSKDIPGNNVLLCGEEKDAYGKDKIITGFTLTLCKTDSVLLNENRSEGTPYLYQVIDGGIAITELDMRVENGNYLYPPTFMQKKFIMVSGKLQVTKNNVTAAPIVSYLKTNFKKLGKLY